MTTRSGAGRRASPSRRTAPCWSATTRTARSSGSSTRPRTSLEPLFQLRHERRQLDVDSRLLDLAVLQVVGNGQWDPHVLVGRRDPRELANVITDNIGLEHGVVAFDD